MVAWNMTVFSFSLAWKAAAPVMKDSIHFEAGDAVNRGLLRTRGTRLIAGPGRVGSGGGFLF